MSCTVVLDTERNTMSVFNDGAFVFRKGSTVINADVFKESNDAYTIIGEETRMVSVVDYSGDCLYSRKQFERLGINKTFESFGPKMVDTSVVRLIAGFIPWSERVSVEKVLVPDGNYGERKSDRRLVTVECRKEIYTIFDYRTDTEDK